MIKISIPRKNKTMAAEEGKNLFNILLENDEFLEGPCGGRGSCGRCKIKHIAGELPGISEDEQRLLSEEEIKAGIRLACHITPKSDIQIDIFDHEKNHKVLTEGFTPDFNINTSIWKKIVDIERPTLENPTPYEELFKRELGLAELDWSTLRSLKMQAGLFTAVYDEDRLIGLECGDTTGDAYGVAVDIGTTTVVASLIDLKTGEEIGNEAEINSQKNFGQDVLTRITYEVENGEQGIIELQRAIVDSLNKMINRICENHNLNRDRIYEISIAGNSTMLHMLLGIEAISLGKAPYAQIFSSSRNIRAVEIGLNAMSPFARLRTLPSVSSYIGADIVAGAYVADLHRTDKRALFIDIGTNGEIVFSDRGKLVACSCAAGPALEGMNISSGMRASDGAIEEMNIGEERISLQVIGGLKPRGLCGSGILAAVREMLKCGLINERGGIVKPDSLASDDYRQKYIVAENSKRYIKITEDIRITQGDIRHVQLAKSAILSGFVALVNYVGLELSDIDEVIIAGQFGAHLPVESLVGTGILPKAVKDKIRYIGNSSKTGAYLNLMSLESRKEMDDISKQMDYMELSVSEGYERLFVESSRFNV